MNMAEFKHVCEYFPDEDPIICTGGAVPNSFKSFFHKNTHIDKLCISLSGGVDSMVASWVLKQLMKETQIVAVHINYNNRDSSHYEQQFVQWWCNKMQIDLNVLNIDLRRSDYMHNGRNFYEKTTHTMRFDMYKAQDCPIVLGHNYDDCIENVITNISKQHIDNLKGMSMTSLINTVPVYRPMLNIWKKDIIAYAKHTHVPYLQDSTPSWSRRGKLRDTLIPTLNSIEPSFIKGLMKLV